ncbi:YtxH domain-containing protein [Bryobacter aggregatus]|uniref:YtxH domain-containing protein n=1 Tax=Bryobacter aggregatus TaxID=360054 RepID=UPI00068932DD|nr:YtxH domain-containing protein [Bryobacter aggregatus]
MAHETSDDAIWFLSGIAIGVTLGLLFAPQSGEETRHKIKKAARKGSDHLRERGQGVYEKGRELFDRGRDLADEASGIFERGRDLVDG